MKYYEPRTPVWLNGWELVVLLLFVKPRLNSYDDYRRIKLAVLWGKLERAQERLRHQKKTSKAPMGKVVNGGLNALESSVSRMVKWMLPDRRK